MSICKLRAKNVWQHCSKMTFLGDSMSFGRQKFDRKTFGRHGIEIDNAKTIVNLLNDRVIVVLVKHCLSQMSFRKMF